MKFNRYMSANENIKEFEHINKNYCSCSFVYFEALKMTSLINKNLYAKYTEEKIKQEAENNENG